ncbi:hydrogenase maturation protease [Aureitalea sp. L0-47]|uniref:hydrogenase maturation protease n=1 Tax=Aureitalea sp. L0-47 TaxID=2816962 RepID=UPI002237A22E|nr:hydrogenase maturation protease [Aureitalea sp. L0-47]MCW5519846.1 hydrogenase maturation protease [Aureitalea sp. L0-47]
MNDSGCKILILGIGNSGRSDDGLGWAFLDAIEGEIPANYDLEYRYQLQVEDAELISQYNRVYFVDAHINTFENGFHLEEGKPLQTDSFTTHQLDPETVLYLADTIYDARPESFILGISGVDFELKIGMSEKASKNLSTALKFFRKEILELTVNH